MRKTIKTKSGMTLYLNTPEEDAAITAAAMSDQDCPPITDEDWEKIKPRLFRGRRPKSAVHKEHINIRLSPDVLRYYRSLGKGWQTRIDEELRKTIPPEFRAAE